MTTRMYYRKLQELQSEKANLKDKQVIPALYPTDFARIQDRDRLREIDTIERKLYIKHKGL
jgi:hypothetical protein